MHARLALTLTAALLAAAALAPTALAASLLPVELAPGEKVVSHATTSQKDSQYIVELLSSIKGIKIDADRTTVLIIDGDKTHPIEIDYGTALSSGSTGGSQETDDGDRGVGLGQIAGLLLGLTIVSRVIGIVRQLGGGNR